MLPLYGRGHLAIPRSVRLSVPWRSCLGYRHAGCLQLSHRRPSEMCGLRTHPRTDVDPPRFCHRRTAIGSGGHIVSPPPGRYLVLYYACRPFAYLTLLALNGCRWSYGIVLWEIVTLGMCLKMFIPTIVSLFVCLRVFSTTMSLRCNFVHNLTV